MKRRWKVLVGASGVVSALALAPIITIETSCRSSIEGLHTDSYNPLIKDAAWKRPETSTWLTYPEWHIVYSAESFGHFLERNPPSGYHYLRDVRAFWSSYCAMNQAAAGQVRVGNRVMLYTIGLSFSAELMMKAAYENTIGRLTEWLGGWHSADDSYATQVQQRYGTFLHEMPWYEFPFGEAFSALWRTSEEQEKLRHWERRLALSSEYGVKAGYAKLIGAASGASLGRDERTLRFVARSDAKTLAAVDPRLRPVGAIGKGELVVEAPRCAQFTDLLVKLSATPIELKEISGNDDILITLLLPPRAPVPGPGIHLLTVAMDDPPGWQRIALSVKVPDLLPILRHAQLNGERVEHIYDY